MGTRRVDILVGSVEARRCASVHRELQRPQVCPGGHGRRLANAPESAVCRDGKLHNDNLTVNEDSCCFGRVYRLGQMTDIVFKYCSTPTSGLNSVGGDPTAIADLSGLRRAGKLPSLYW